MIDINSSNFINDFYMPKATVGVIGHGFVGKAVDEFFKGKCNVLVHDRQKPELQTLKQVVEGSEVIFVCVNTPMRNDGSCYTGFVEEVIADVKKVATEISRPVDSFVMCVKSTVYPGFIEDMQAKFLPMRLTFSPEFLTEANSVHDFKNTNRIIVGGMEDDALIVCKYFAEADPDKLLPSRDEPPRRLILQTDSTTAEMVKLYANGILTAKVMFSNEIYLICEKLGISYNDVRSIACLDQRIGMGHTQVPGPDGHLGYGGHCFPKDVNSLVAISKELGTGEKLFTAMVQRNEEIREKKDWLEMKDRAVTDK